MVGNGVTALLPSAAQAARAALAMASDPEVRRSVAVESPIVFAATYLNLATPRHWQKWSRYAEEYKQLLVLAPRAHGKSEFWTRTYPLFRIAKNRNIRILIVSGKFDSAKKSLLAIKEQLENNELLRTDFASDRPWHPTLADASGYPGETDEPDDAYLELVDNPSIRRQLRRQVKSQKRVTKERTKRGNPWTQRQLYVLRDVVKPDPTIEAVGVFGKITGGRFDIIVIDDPDDEDSVRQAKQRDRRWNWIVSEALELLEPGGQAIVVQTRKHNDDTAGRCIQDPYWFVIHDLAISKWPGGLAAANRDEYGTLHPIEPDRTKWKVHKKLDQATGQETIVRVECEPGAEVLWPEKWPIELLIPKFDKNWIMALREQQQFVTDGGSGDIRLEWLNASRAKDLSFATGADDPLIQQLGIDLIVQAWDLALLDEKKKAEETDSDFTVGWTVGINTTTWHRYVLHIYRDRGLTPKQLRSQIKQLAARFGPLYIGIEVNAFAKLHKIELSRTTDLPLYPHTTTGSGKTHAEEGIPRLATLFENGKYTLPYGDRTTRAVVDSFIAEAHGFGVEAHDDTVLSLWVLESVVGRYQRACEEWVRRGKVPPHIARRIARGEKIENSEAQSNPATKAKRKPLRRRSVR